MAAAPYEHSFRRDGELSFFAPVPTMAHIGQGFDELNDASLNFKRPPGEIEPWQRLCHRLQGLVDEAKQGTLPPSWPELQAKLSREFPENFTKLNINPNVREYFETNQMPVGEYVEWVLLAASQQWAAVADDDFDWDAFQARIERLTSQLREAGYTTARDRQARAEDPAGYAARLRMLEQTMNALNQPDPADYEKMVAQQLEALQKSPLFDQMKERFERTKELLGGMDLTPEEREQQRRGFEQVEKLWSDPAGHLRDLMAGLAAGKEMPPGMSDEDFDDLGADEGDDADHDFPQAAPGEFLFRCGDREKPTPKQVAQFEAFLAAQEQLRPEIEKALRDMHKWMDPGGRFPIAGDRVFFPENPDDSDVPLQCFKVTAITLSGKKGGSVVIDFDTPFGHFDEHGCMIVIRNGKLVRYGTFDDVEE